MSRIFFTLILLSFFISGYKTDEKSYFQQLKKWKIAPAKSATTPGLNAIAVTDADEIVKAADYQTSAWINAEVPGTVLGNLVENRIYEGIFLPDNNGKKNEYFSDNLSKIPSGDFENQWWYSTDFTIPSAEAGKRVTLTFRGINYAGKIFVNGTEVKNNHINIKDESYLKNGPTLLTPAAAITDYTSDGAGSLKGASDFSEYKSQFIGAMRTYDIDITDLVKSGGANNNVKVKVTKPEYRNDLAYYWVDWNPQPADAMMGITGEVVLCTSGAVKLANPVVTSKVDADLKGAHLSFYVDASNFTDAGISGSLKAVIKDPAGKIVATITKEDLKIPSATYNQEIDLRASAYPQLNLVSPKLWWPHLSGDQPLYTIDYEFITDGAVSDRLHHRFGIREISTEVNVSPYANNYSDTIAASHLSNMLQLYVNHRPVLLKGGGYCPTDLFLRHNKETNKAVVEYIKYMGMNMIRDEGKFFDNDLLDLMDENGVLLMTGWCCCDRWQSPGSFSKAERFVAFESLYAQLRNARRHACMVLWFNGSDDPPSIASQGVNGQNVEQKYFEIEANLRLLETGANSNNGSAKVATLTGLTGGMHMDATYDSQTPSWYYFDNKGLYGFISEGGGGGSIPVAETMKKIIPEKNLWPYNSSENYNVWNYHVCRGSFSNLGQHVSFIDGSYGASSSIEEFIARAQVFQYDLQRAQYEALNINRFKNTSGFVNWMLNNAWPIMFWNQFDFYLNPNGTTYGARKGNEPVHILYNVYNKCVNVVNNTFNDYHEATATVSIYDIDGILISKPLKKTINIPADGATAAVKYRVSGINNSGPQAIGLIKNTSGSYDPYRVNYYGKINESHGVVDIWKYEDIQASLVRPASDVYFIRLELKDSDGRLLSLNSYAEALRSDIAGASHSWNRSGTHQVSDLTQLNQLPSVNLKLTQTEFKKEGEKNILTCRVENPTGKVAYAVELKAYADKEMKLLVAPVTYDDNLFILFPGETRDIKIIYNRSVLPGKAFINVNCYNNIIRKSDERAAMNIYRAVPQGGSNNLARGKAVLGGNNPSNATTVSEGAQSKANAGKTFIDSDMNSFAALSPDQGSFIVDLGSVQTFDRIMLRWNRTNNLRGRPDHIKIEVSDDNTSYSTVVADYDNSRMGSVMTNIILPNKVKGRFVKITPSGLTGVSPAFGMAEKLKSGGVSGQSVSGVAQADASKEFVLSAIEIYPFRRSVFFTVEGSGKVTSGDKVMTSSTWANNRVVTIGESDTVNFSCVPDASATSGVKLLRDNVDISALIKPDGTITLTDITKDTDIKVTFR